MSTTTTQIVLAAGRSRRMGSPKPLLDFDGKTALELILEAGQRAGTRGSIVVIGHRADDVRKAHQGFTDVEWVVNHDPDSQQLRSLQLGLEALAPGSAFFIHPVDCPLVGAADYELLIDAYRRAEGDASVYFITHEARHGHPVLCAAPLAKELLALDETRTARDVIGSEPSVDVHTDNDGVLCNMNTPQDYEALLEMYRAER